MLQKHILQQKVVQRPLFIDTINGKGNLATWL